jgi:Membrane protein involved in the export of O-antigen and teichoic acid
MSTPAYSAWVLALQSAAYLGYLDFGLQTAIGRYVAYANQKNDTDGRDAIYSTAFIGLTIAGLVGLIVLTVIAVTAKQIFPALPPELLLPLRTIMLVVGGAQALALPASAWSGVFIGLQKYEIPALTVGTGKLLAAVALIWAAMTGKSLIFMSFAFAIANVASYACLYIMKRRSAPEIRLRLELIRRPVIKELWGYCLSLSIWSFSMLLVNGFDLILVGRFEFGAVTPFSVSSTLITFLAGVQTAVFGVIMPHAAELHAQEFPEQLGRLLIKATRLGVLLLLDTGLPLVVFAAPIINLWIGPQFAQTGGSIMTILVIANMIRLIGTPYASILIGTGQQRLVIMGPLMEGVTNLIFSIGLGLKFGAIGVALGTLVGSVVGMLANIFYNLPRTRECIRVREREYFGRGILLPSVASLPVCIALFCCGARRDTTTMIAGFVCTFIVSLFFMRDSISQLRRA